jgi:hypothetical protein
MRKFLYIAIAIIVVGLASGFGNKDASKPAYTQAMAKASGAPACLVNLEKFTAMKDGMSYFQIERDIGCAGIQTSSVSAGRSTTYVAAWKGSGSFGANAKAVFRNDLLVGKSQYGLK